MWKEYLATCQVTIEVTVSLEVTVVVTSGEVIVEESPAVWGPKVGNDSEAI